MARRWCYLRMMRESLRLCLALRCTLGLIILFEIESQAQCTYNLPRSQILGDEGIKRIDLYRQSLTDLPFWSADGALKSQAARKGDPWLEASYELNSKGYVQHLVEYDEEQKIQRRTQLVYDSADRIVSITSSLPPSDLVIEERFEYAPDSIVYLNIRNGKWARKMVLDADTILLRDHMRNDEDSGSYVYDPSTETVLNETFARNEPAYRKELRYIMKEGRPDSLYLKTDYVQEAFDTYLLSEAPAHIEGMVDVLESGEAVVPESNPLSTVLETGFKFGDHRTKARLPGFREMNRFILDSLLKESEVWPEIQDDGSARRWYYLIHYNQ